MYIHLLSCCFYCTCITLVVSVCLISQGRKTVTLVHWTQITHQKCFKQKNKKWPSEEFLTWLRRPLVHQVLQAAACSQKKEAFYRSLSLHRYNSYFGVMILRGSVIVLVKLVLQMQMFPCAGLNAPELPLRVIFIIS